MSRKYSLRSMPAEKASPAPVSTTTAASGSASIALRLPGRLSVTQATPSVISTSTQLQRFQVLIDSPCSRALNLIVSGKLIQMERMGGHVSGDPGAADPPLLSYTVGRLDRAIRQVLREILAPHELSVPQFTTLSVIKRRPGLSNAQLARRALILPQSMIQVIAELESRDLVKRTP